MATEQQIQANRANAQLSCGPKTTEGKSKSSQNAVKHGLLSQQVVIEGEERSAFEALHAGLHASFSPEGELEQLLVDKITMYAWRLRRLVHAEAAMVAKGAESTYSPKTLDSFFEGYSAKKMATMTRYEANLSRHFYRAIIQLRELQADRQAVSRAEANLAFGFVW